jgi:TonB family protein
MDAVSAVLVRRAHDPARLTPLVGWSAVAHVVTVLIVAVLPASWFGARLAEDAPVVIQISLDGAAGPRDGGLVTQGARPTQEERLPELKSVREPIRAPAARAPEMVEPTKAAPKKLTPAAKVEAKDPRSRTPTKGEKIEQGSAVAQTAAKGQGFGLSSGGGGGTGGYLDVANFCCPEYLATMIDLINRNWNSKQGARGTTLLKFDIERDGRIANVMVEKSSGVPALDYFSQRSLALTRQFPPLPAAYPGERLTLHLYMDYVP